jgi:hypothetical protein
LQVLQEKDIETAESLEALLAWTAQQETCFQEEILVHVRGIASHSKDEMDEPVKYVYTYNYDIYICHNYIINDFYAEPHCQTCLSGPALMYQHMPDSSIFYTCLPLNILKVFVFFRCQQRCI